MGLGKLKNNSTVMITYTLEWENGLTENDVLQPKEEVEINCGDEKAKLCHRSDGGIYGACPANSKTFEAEDYYLLLEDGEYEN